MAFRPYGSLPRLLGSIGVLSLGAAATVGVLGLTGGPGCNVYGPSLLLSAPSASTTVGCLHAAWPSPPGPDDAAGQSIPLVVAMQTLDLGVGDAGTPVPSGPLPTFGWDLDGVCTCPGPPSCMQNEGPENCDDDAGRDETGLKLFRKLGASAQGGVAAATASLQTGQYGLLLQITNYNGQPNDGQVSVALYFSNGVAGAGDGGVTLKHDGTDVWTVDPRSIAGYMNAPNQFMGIDCYDNPQCQPQYVTDLAYVSNNVLVASLGEVPITFGGRANIGGAVMDLTETVLVGTLSPQSVNTGGTSWGIKGGSVSGRWNSSKLLSNMATIPDPTSDAGGFLCGDASAAYQLLKGYICELQDITSDPSRQNESPLASCDAISMSFGFTAEPAQIGAVAPLPATVQGCEDGGLPFSDHCPL